MLEVLNMYQDTTQSQMVGKALHTHLPECKEPWIGFESAAWPLHWPGEDRYTGNAPWKTPHISPIPSHHLGNSPQSLSDAATVHFLLPPDGSFRMPCEDYSDQSFWCVHCPLKQCGLNSMFSERRAVTSLPKWNHQRTQPFHWKSSERLPFKKSLGCGLQAVRWMSEARADTYAAATEMRSRGSGWLMQLRLLVAD